MVPTDHSGGESGRSPGRSFRTTPGGVAGPPPRTSSAGSAGPERRLHPGTRSGYAPADREGNFLAVPDEDTTDSGHPRVDFDDLEYDPSERRPQRGPVAEALRAAGPQVRLFKWIAPLVVYAAALMVQSMALYVTTLRMMTRAHAAAPENPLATGALPRDHFVAWLGGPRGSQDKGGAASGTVPQVAVEVLACAVPIGWLLVAIFRQEIRLWSRTLAVGATLCILNSFVAMVTTLPGPGGPEACLGRLGPAARGHFEAASKPPYGLTQMLASLMWVLWLWVQDLVCAMRRQRGLVCATGFSGPSSLCALTAMGLFDAARTWARRLKPMFRTSCHVLSAVVLSSVVILDGVVDIVDERQYTMDVVLAFVFSLLLYSSPIMAVMADVFLMSGSHLAATKDQEGFDVGDVVTPPCCLPFCTLHGRYFLFMRSAAETEESYRLHQRAARETEEAKLAREDAARRLEDLEQQLRSMRQGALVRERQEEAESAKRTAQQASEARQAHELRVQKGLAAVESTARADREASRELEAKLLQEESRLKELELRYEAHRQQLEEDLAAARGEEAAARKALEFSQERAAEKAMELQELIDRLEDFNNTAGACGLPDVFALKQIVADSPPIVQEAPAPVTEELSVDSLLQSSPSAVFAAAGERELRAQQGPALLPAGLRPWYLRPSVQPTIFLLPYNPGIAS